MVGHDADDDASAGAGVGVGDMVGATEEDNVEGAEDDTDKQGNDPVGREEDEKNGTEYAGAGGKSLARNNNDGDGDGEESVSDDEMVREAGEIGGTDKGDQDEEEANKETDDDDDDEDKDKDEDEEKGNEQVDERTARDGKSNGRSDELEVTVRVDEVVGSQELAVDWIVDSTFVVIGAGERSDVVVEDVVCGGTGAPEALSAGASLSFVPSSLSPDSSSSLLSSLLERRVRRAERIRSSFAAARCFFLASARDRSRSRSFRRAMISSATFCWFSMRCLRRALRSALDFSLSSAVGSGFPFGLACCSTSLSLALSFFTSSLTVLCASVRFSSFSLAFSFFPSSLTLLCASVRFSFLRLALGSSPSEDVGDCEREGRASLCEDLRFADLSCCDADDTGDGDREEWPVASTCFCFVALSCDFGLVPPSGEEERPCPGFFFFLTTVDGDGDRECAATVALISFRFVAFGSASGE